MGNYCRAARSALITIAYLVQIIHLIKDYKETKLILELSQNKTTIVAW